MSKTSRSKESESEDSEPEAPKYLTNEFLGQLNDKKQKQVTRKQKGTGEAEEIDRSISFLPSTKKQRKSLENKENEENGVNSALPERFNTTTTTTTTVTSTESFDDVDWEDVTNGVNEEVNTTEDKVRSLPTEDITISFQVEEKKKEKEKPKKKGVTKDDREDALELHKAHLVTLIANRLYITSYLTDESLQALLFSLVPNDLVNIIIGKQITKPNIVKLIEWFHSYFIVIQEEKNKPISVEDYKPQKFGLEALFDAIEERVLNFQQTSEVFVSLCKSLGILSRYVSILDPISKKAKIKNESSEDKESPTKKIKTEKVKEEKPVKRKKDAYVKKNTETVDRSTPTSWAEIFFPAENRWIRKKENSKKFLIVIDVDPMRKFVDKVDSCQDKKFPLLYVFAFEPKIITDVTRRYASKWTASIQLRVSDESWINQTLRVLSYHERLTMEERQRVSLEKMELESLGNVEEMPTSVEGFRRHPLYIIEKCVTKYQTIHPKEPVGIFKNQPVYHRSALHDLHTLTQWLQEARVIKENEQPCKLVKKKKKNKEDPDEETSLYGYWQTEPYVPKPAIDGILPKNEHGNIYLYKPEMLPPGTVHLRVNNVIRLCKKFGIDFAPALVGWDFHSGKNIPIIDGIVVCKEQAEMLTDAWEQDQSRLAEEKQKKKEKIVVKRWESLVKKLLIREKLKQKYESPLDQNATPTSYQAHIHNFEADSEFFDEESKQWKKKCSCGLVIVFEKL